jgi:hypothetical protein
MIELNCTMELVILKALPESSALRVLEALGKAR